MVPRPQAKLREICGGAIEYVIQGWRRPGDPFTKSLYRLLQTQGFDPEGIGVDRDIGVT